MNLKKIKQWTNKTKFSFWIIYLLSRLLSVLYIRFTKKVAPLPLFETLKDVELGLEKISYLADEFNLQGYAVPHFWMRTAEETQWLMNKGITSKFGQDCDEFAMYAAKALLQVPEAMHPMILTVRWVMPDGSLQGHNVALYGYITQDWIRLYGHIGNWGHFRGYNSVAQLATDIAKQGGGSLLSYATASVRLEMKYHESA